MGKNKKEICIFCASPSDVADERQVLDDVVRDLNRQGGSAHNLGIILRLVKYETDVAPDAGASQPVVFEQVPPEEWDIFIGILWMRFGTETGTIDPETGVSYLSGTEEEFKKVYKIRRQSTNGWPKILFYRCTRLPESLTFFDDSENSRQYDRVKAFFEQCGPNGAHKAHVVHFDKTKNFTGQVRNDLEKYLWNYAELHHLPGADKKTRKDETTFRSLKAQDHQTLNRYLREVWYDCLTLKLTTIDIKAAKGVGETAELDLHAVYTDLDVKEMQEMEEFKDDSKTAERLFEKTGGPVRLNVMAAIAKYHHVVILGDPGSGKSTLVNFLALCLAGEGVGSSDVNLKKLGEGWSLPALLPLRVILRDYAARGLSGDLSIWQFIQDELKSRTTCTGENLGACIDLFRHLLGQQNGCILLLDGVDEVPEARRCRVHLKKMVEQFRKDFPDCRILVTSRPYAYQDPEAHLTGFEIRTLADFSSEQIQMFINRWYTSLGQKDRTLGTVTAQRYATQLQKAVRNNPRLAELAPRPLLLTLMASLHRWREGGSLPEKRQELYEAGVNLLLELWQKPKLLFDAQGNFTETQYDVWNELGISSEGLRNALNKIAYEAHCLGSPKEGTSDIRVRELVGILYDQSDKAKTGTDREVGYSRIIDYITERTGLLIEREQRSIYTFPHRTFQEYLAASYLADTDFPFILAERLKEDEERWREVSLLAAAKAVSGSKSSIWNLVNEFCKQEYHNDKQFKKHDWYAALYAALALVETEQHKNVPERQQISMNRLKNWLKALVEESGLPVPDRAQAGRLLSLIGDIRKGVGVTAEGIPDIAWCQVPAGSFVMGTREEDISKLLQEYQGEKEWYERETPQLQPLLSAYLVSRYPVTQVQFRAFMHDGGYGKSDYWIEAKKAGVWKNGTVKKTFYYYEDKEWKSRKEIGRGPVVVGGAWDLDNHPVVGVCWYEAVAFCRWLTEKIQDRKDLILSFVDDEKLRAEIDQKGFMVRLPTEKEWEKASRGTDGRFFPWGDSFETGNCNSYETGIGSTSTVGLFPKGVSPYECCDMAGNVWEWCRSKWLDNYSNYEKHENDRDSPYGTAARVLRGGAF
ncbi:SUMF1/EgtB/PvdO family nonheme iron enzyme, partial [candidate division KSB1 bacterium]|nr:SUMF1/EgtB/PvdO family nonheme iron enzyme [candidate division KSB1 bacterium]